MLERPDERTDPSPAATPPPQWSPWIVAALGVVAVAAVGMAVMGNDGLTADEAVRGGLVVAWAVTAGILFTRPFLHRLGLLVLLGSAVAGLTYLACAALGDGWDGPSRDIARVVRPFGVGLLPALVFVLLLALPRGHFRRRARIVSAWIGIGCGLAYGAALWSARPSIPAWTLWVAAGLVVVAGVPPAHRRYTTTSGLDRQRAQLIGIGVALSIEVALIIAAFEVFAGWPRQGAEIVAAATVLVPAGLAAGAFHQLVVRVDRLLVHTVSIAGITSVVVGVYLLIVLGLGRAPDEEERRLLLLSIGAAGLAAVLYLPTRRRFSEVANRIVYGEREAPDEVLRTFGTRLSRAIPMDELLLQLAESLRKTMGLQAAEVWTGSAERLERTVSVPDRGSAVLVLGPAEQPVVARAGVSGNAWLAIWLPTLLEGRGEAQLRVAPVCHSGEVLGLIVAERHAEGDLFTEDDERVLTELARQVALALHNVQLDSALQASLDELRHQAEELRASRARIVATADAERRRIERNLHDGAQQHLVALAVNLRLARDLMGDDPTAAAEMLEELGGTIKDAIQELRDLAHGIYPPLLMDSGLGEALRAAAARSPLGVDVVTNGVGRHATEVEAAVYFCCLEAMQNAAKHAPGSHVDVRVWEEAGRLLFRIHDDGPGFDVAAKGRGHGFTNMLDRVGAIGGTVTWDSVIGQGTTVSGSIPLTD